MINGPLVLLGGLALFGLAGLAVAAHEQLGAASCRSTSAWG
ncbi:hypothetical protein [Bosea sp. R86505]